MLTDVGEYLVGAYLQLFENCDFVDYNVRPPGGGMKGLGELDVVGLQANRGQVLNFEIAIIGNIGNWHERYKTI